MALHRIRFLKSTQTIHTQKIIDGVGVNVVWGPEKYDSLKESEIKSEQVREE